MVGFGGELVAFGLSLLFPGQYGFDFSEFSVVL